MNVLVVGGAGYIGSHTARALQRAGHQVRIFDNLSTGHRFLANGFELTVGDIHDPPTLAKALRGMDAVMHFAAHAYVGESVVNPRKYFDNNVTGALTLLNAIVDSGLQLVIFSSSCAVYGNAATVPIVEHTPKLPINPYGVSKLFFENALAAYQQAYGVRCACLRYFNAAGADESGDIGELHDPETHLIPLALKAAAGTGPALQVFGDDYPTRDGTCIRDYVHVNDLATAHVLALERLHGTKDSLSLNLGNGHGYSVKDVIASVELVTGCPVPHRFTERRPGDPPVLVADSTHAYQLLGWSAKRDLIEIVSTAWKWQQNSRTQQRLRASA